MAPSSTAGTSTSRSGCGAVIQVVNNARSPSASDWSLQQVDERIQVGNGQRRISSMVWAAGRNPASASNWLQRHQQLGLVAGVAVVAHRRVERDAEPLLAPVTLGGLLGAGVRLQRQRLVGRQHLDQERQRVAESGAGRGAELAFGIGEHGLQQRDFAVRLFQPGRIAGVAPSQSSASGCAAGTGRPVNSAMAVRDPHA